MYSTVQLYSSLVIFQPLPSFHCVSCGLCCSLLQRFSGCGSGRRADVSRGRRARVHCRMCARPAHRRQRARRSKYCTVHSTPLQSTLLLFLSSCLFHSAFVWLLKLSLWLRSVHYEYMWKLISSTIVSMLVICKLYCTSRERIPSTSTNNIRLRELFVFLLRPIHLLYIAV